MLRNLKDFTNNEDRFLVDEKSLNDFQLPIDLAVKLSAALNERGFIINSFSSFAVTEKATNNKPANYAVIPNQYFVFAAEIYEFSTSLNEYFKIFEKLRKNASLLVGSAEEVEDNIKKTPTIRSFFGTDDGDVSAFSKFIDRDESSYRLGAKRLVDNQGVARGSSDCFSSVILKYINLPDSSSSIFGRLVYELVQKPEIFQELNAYYTSVKEKHRNNVLFKLKKDFPQNPNTTYISKPFLLLAGISGTGKTRFVREQAARYDSGENYCLVSVRPDWHEPSDLLGYISRMGTSPEFVCTDVLKFMVSAWKSIITGISKDNGRCDWDGKPLGDVIPFWLCLDEMNLAPVEQYFADYLSVLETRHWFSTDELDDFNKRNGTTEEYVYECEPLLKPDVIAQLDKQGQKKMAHSLGLDLDDDDEDIWEYFCQNGIAIPFNLIVAGTVNMDETTHGFSRKVIDRALTIDFGEFFPNDFGQFFSPETQPLTFSYPIWSDGRDSKQLATTFDEDGSRSVAFLSEINTVLGGTPFMLAYRALNELLLSVIAAGPGTEAELLAVWDDFLMSKVLPRIEGDADKLWVDNADSGNTEALTVLDELVNSLKVSLMGIWDEECRPDLYRESLSAGSGSRSVMIGCRSKAKLAWMKSRLERATFTSFWP